MSKVSLRWHPYLAHCHDRDYAHLHAYCLGGHFHEDLQMTCKRKVTSDYIFIQQGKG